MPTPNERIPEHQNKSLESPKLIINKCIETFFTGICKSAVAS